MSQPDDPSDGPPPREPDRVYLETLFHLHESQIARFNKRRDVEWRLTFTLWGGLVLAANAIKGLSLPGWAVWSLSLLLPVVVVFHAVWEKWYMVDTAESNRDAGIDLYDIICEKVGLGKEIRKPYNPWAAHYWQVGVTALLVLLVVAAANWS